MKSSGRPARAPFPQILFILTAATALGQPPLERIRFKDMPSAEPIREVLQTVLGSRFYSMREEFPPGEWAGGGYGAAWERAKRYFPGDTYFVVPGTYFMTHGFDADGRLFMEIHESAYLRLWVENRQTFTPGSIVGAYGRMLAAADDREMASFREKTGRLETYFRDEQALGQLREILGEAIYLGFLKALREEDYHMLAGGLIHEGTHAGMDDARVARIQSEFNAGKRPVQWDELRAFMAEIGYHGSYGRWAVNDLAGNWRRAESLLGDLEGLRKRPALRPGPDRARFEKVRAQAWVYAACIRLRMREIWQSARRMRDLAGSVRKDYIGAAAPPGVEEMLEQLEGETAGFVKATGEAIQATELAARSLEEVLDTWSEWAAGGRPFPPPITDSRSVVNRAKGIRWPDPVTAGGALMKRAGEELEKERPPS